MALQICHHMHPAQVALLCHMFRVSASSPMATLFGSLLRFRLRIVSVSGAKDYYCSNTARVKFNFRISAQHSV